MRDNNRCMPELIDTIKEKELFFGIVRLERMNETGYFKFGVTSAEYVAWRKIASLKPFDNLSRELIKYFFSPCTWRIEGRTFCRIRIEQGKDGKEFDVQLPERLIANLLWFFELESLEKADHLRIELKT
ncbi:MAG TPA: hypothetical protein PK747_03645 [Acidobacteriota bacterium]|nr:hypothetical protein [Acidobacteriota bacterium]HNT16789.1 hypothetical protein [Acidobacteriota bacterium]HPA26426.1 hypothetical protein [Acidobacteriota bacterium]HQO19332.1 hypothetical protein [Acidobacteriota bacterium]HQQ46487.1 hypothetical protein [Acidobacteriota bacterium]